MNTSPNELSLRQIFLFVIAMFFVFSAIEVDQLEARTDSSPKAESEKTVTVEEISSEDQQREKDQKVTAAFYMLGMIAFVGIVFIMFVLLWGVRMRRIARISLPKQSIQDEHWHLKPKKEIPDGETSESE